MMGYVVRLRAWATLLVALSTTGCATTLGLVRGPDLETTAVRMSLEPAGTGLQLTVEVPQARPAAGSSLMSFLGLGLDALVAANLPLVAMSFRSTQDAHAVALLSAIGTVALDRWLADGLSSPAVVRSVSRLLFLDEDGSILKSAELGVLEPGTHTWKAVAVPRGAVVLQLIDGSGHTLAARPVSSPEAPRLAKRPPGVKVVPPKLALEVSYKDREGQNLVEAELGGWLEVTVRNSGGPSEGAVLKLQSLKQVPGLSFENRKALGDMAAGETRKVSIPLKADASLPSGELRLKVSFEDRKGYDAQPSVLVLTTQALRLPDLVIDDIGIDNQKDGVLSRGQELQVLARIVNRGMGKAREVKSTLVFPSREVERAFVLVDDTLVHQLGDIPPGGAVVATYSLMVKNSY